MVTIEITNNLKLQQQIGIDTNLTSVTYKISIHVQLSSSLYFIDVTHCIFTLCVIIIIVL